MFVITCRNMPASGSIKKPSNAGRATCGALSMTEAAAPATEQPDTVESDAEFFAKAGPLPTAWDEARRHPRFHYRSRVQATVHPFHGAPQAPVECALLTRDLSRGGI